MTRVDRSYSPYKEVREYQDRAMMKWQGFYLSEHTTAMKDDKAPKKYFAIKVIGYLIYKNEIFKSHFSVGNGYMFVSYL